MALNQLGLGFIFSAKDLASGVMDKIHGKFVDLEGKSSAVAKSVQGHMRTAAMGFTVMGTGIAGLFGLKTAADAAGQFEQALAAAGAIAGATTQDMKALERAAMDAGMATQFSPVEATKGLQDLAAAGFSVEQSIGLLRPTLDLAAGSLGELTPQSAAGLAAQAIKAFGLEVKDAGLAVDQMLQGVNVFALGAGELPMALGTASRGAQALNQSLSETMIALGLVKDIIPGVERASTAVAVSMERMADPKVQQKLKGIGVAVTDSKDQFRDFLDIVGDMTPKLGEMSEAQRSAFLMSTFGNEALGGLNAILTQVKNGVRSSSGELLKGGAAIDYLRGQFTNAGGTAAKFRDTMLGTYDGAKQALSNIAATWAIAIGEPIKNALKPVIVALADFGRRALAAFQKIPKPVTDFIGKVALLGSALAVLVGGMVAFKSTLSVASIGLRLLGVSASTALAAFGPVVLAVAAASAAFYTFKAAYDANIGGFGDFVDKTWKKVSLAFRAIGQLFSDGGFSGDVLTELGENKGVEDFAIGVFVWVNRAVEWFRGLSEGFNEGLAKAKPTFDSFMASLEKLGSSLGLTSSAVDPLGNGGKFDAAGKSGKSMGQKLAIAAEALVKVMDAGVKLTTKIVDVISALGGVETIAKAVTVAMIYMAVNSIAKAGAALIELGPAAMQATYNMGLLLVKLQGVTWTSAAAKVSGALKSIGLAADSTQVKVLAVTAAIAALWLAYDQYQKLAAVWDENSSNQIWSKFKNDIGYTSDDEYAREMEERQGIITGSDYDRREAYKERYGADVFDQKKPAAGPGPMPAATSAAAAAEAQSGGSGASAAAATQALTDAAKRIQTPQTIVSGTMVLDGVAMGEFIARTQANEGNRAGIPGALAMG